MIPGLEILAVSQQTATSEFGFNLYFMKWWSPTNVHAHTQHSPSHTPTHTVLSLTDRSKFVVSRFFTLVGLFVEFCEALLLLEFRLELILYSSCVGGEVADSSAQV